MVIDERVVSLDPMKTEGPTASIMISIVALVKLVLPGFEGRVEPFLLFVVDRVEGRFYLEPGERLRLPSDKSGGIKGPRARYTPGTQLEMLDTRSLSLLRARCC